MGENSRCPEVTAVLQKLLECSMKHGEQPMAVIASAVMGAWFSFREWQMMEHIMPFVTVERDRVVEQIRVIDEELALIAQSENSP